jgi:hypothetical protein
LADGAEAASLEEFMKNEKPDKRKRFQIRHRENLSFAEGVKVIVDTQTGVQYLLVNSGYAGGLTPLLNRDGTPMIISPSNSER